MRWLRARCPTGALVLVLLAAQVAIARYAPAPALAPAPATLPPVPGRAMLAATSLGELQTWFRAHSLRLQHLGNLGGRMVPYRDLDYARLAEWLAALDEIDARADVVATMAAYLFVNTQTAADTRYLVDYLVRHGRRDPVRKWRWLALAVHIARHKLGDLERALEIARTLRALAVPGVPHWARQLEVFVLTDIGETAAAKRLLLTILATDRSLPAHERRWIEFYIRRKLGG